MGTYQACLLGQGPLDLGDGTRLGCRYHQGEVERVVSVIPTGEQVHFHFPEPVENLLYHLLCVLTNT